MKQCRARKRIRGVVLRLQEVLRVRRLRLSISIVLAVLVAATAGLGTSPRAKAGLVTCAETTERPFTAWGDYAPYALAPNGDFESTDGWTLSGGSRAQGGNNPFRSGAKSLVLPSGSSATSPVVCVKAIDAAARFFLVNGGSSATRLKVEILYRSALGLRVAETLGTVSAGGRWDASPKFFYLGSVLGLLELGDTSTPVQFRFTPQGLGSGFRIDDLFVDPYVTV
jgi:hypothetical protein